MSERGTRHIHKSTYDVYDPHNVWVGKQKYIDMPPLHPMYIIYDIKKQSCFLSWNLIHLRVGIQGKESGGTQEYTAASIVQVYTV